MSLRRARVRAPADCGLKGDHKDRSKEASSLRKTLIPTQRIVDPVCWRGGVAESMWCIVEPLRRSPAGGIDNPAASLRRPSDCVAPSVRSTHHPSEAAQSWGCEGAGAVRCDSGVCNSDDQLWIDDALSRPALSDLAHCRDGLVDSGTVDIEMGDPAHPPTGPETRRDAELT